MKKLSRLFGGISMSWPRVLWFSLAVGVFCGIFAGIPALSDTSFTDMAGGYEWWVIFAVIITVNCDRFWDAGLKCGVFFLITQPLQFAIQALVDGHELAKAWYYFILWLPVIIATVPGGMISHFAKRQNVWGAAILGIGNAMELLMGLYYVSAFLDAPPRHLIASVVSLASIVLMTLSLQKTAKGRIIAFAVAILLTGAVAGYFLYVGLTVFA